MAYKEKNQKELEINERLVLSLVKRYYQEGMEMDALIASGNKGLELARKHFDPSKGVRFICYAVWFIRKSIETNISTTKA